MRLLFTGYLHAQALLRLPEFGREFGTEVIRLEHLPNLDLGLSFKRIGTALDPLDRLFLRFHLE